MHTALLWKQEPDSQTVRCKLCSHFCRIESGQRGLCGVRENREGTLYTLVADRVAALNIDPVEKKPLYHFHPGTLTFSLGTMGCNFSCTFCQNSSLSQPPRQGLTIEGRKISPEEIVQNALSNRVHSISYTYSEPTIFFELMLPTAKLAKTRGLANIIVSNGYQSPECLEELGPYIDAANIDLKSFRDSFYQEQCGARLKPVLRNLKHIKKLGWWLEITTLIIPGLNDSTEELTELALFIGKELSTETPWHISRFHPDYRLLDRPPTPLETLERAWQIGKDAGLEYVYVGNVPGHDGNNTMCPEGCGPVIQRRGFTVAQASATCPKCGRAMAGVGLNTLGS
jgi:pyruvate formate lyase activating enzyme